ncbi:MAG: zinc metallopeptidase [Bacillota bacterium]
MPFMFFDPTMIILLPAIILAGYAQMKVKSTFNKYLNVRAKIGKTGAQVARELLDQNGLSHINVVQTNGKLSDHYDPQEEVLRLSPDVYNGTSLASLGVAAHETGHAIQDKESYGPLRFRHSLFPAARFGSQAGPILALVGFFFFHSQLLVNLGILVFIAAVLFQVVTLPVEFNASSRALRLLRQNSYLNSQETKGAKKVLNAAALTYVASTLVAIGHLLRLLLLSSMLDE